MIAWQIPPMAMLALIMVVIFLLGWPFEWPAIILVFVPLLQPVIVGMKIDMLWFATLIAVNLQTAFLSPPVAMSAYYLKGVAPSVVPRRHLPRHGPVHGAPARRPRASASSSRTSRSGSRAGCSANNPVTEEEP